jgi:hypothetical protein
MGIPLRPDREGLAREWKHDFIRSATVSVLSRVRKTDPREVELEIRAPVSPLKASDFGGGSVVKIILLAPKSAASQLFTLATVVDLRGIDTLSFPSPTNFADASFVAEGQPIALRQGTFAGFTIGPVRKLALLSALSGELETATGGVATTIIGHTLETAVGRGLDKVLLSPDAADADSPAGLLHNVTPITGSASMAKDLSALIAAIAAAGIDTASVVFICAPPQAMSLSLTAGPHFSHRIIEAASLANGTVVAIATSALIVAGEGTPVIDTSKQATLHFSDPASQIATTGTIATPTVSTFQSDLLALRCIARLTWATAPGAVSELTGATW